MSMKTKVMGLFNIKPKMFKWSDLIGRRVQVLDLWELPKEASPTCLVAKDLDDNVIYLIDVKEAE